MLHYRVVKMLDQHLLTNSLWTDSVFVRAQDDYETLWICFILNKQELWTQLAWDTLFSFGLNTKTHPGQVSRAQSWEQHRNLFLTSDCLPKNSDLTSRQAEGHPWKMRLYSQWKELIKKNVWSWRFSKNYLHFLFWPPRYLRISSNCQSVCVCVRLPADVVILRCV